MFNVYPYSTIHGAIEIESRANRVKQCTRINNEQTWKESPTMHSPLIVLEAHVQAVNTNRLQQALKAERIRVATAGQPGAIDQLIRRVRRATGQALISLGTRLRREPRATSAREIQAMTATPTRMTSS